MRLAPLVLVLAASTAGAAERFAMTVYHFNIQYVAGGVQGWPDGTNTDPTFAMDEAATEDAIIVESFEPLLDIYLRHPTWGGDFELQGMMLDVLRARHPAVLAKLKTLTDRQQISVDSFHWSDQLWVAYPRRDQEKSFELVQRSFQAAGIPLGSSVWTQEGQFGPGLARFMKERGLKTAVLPRNLFKWLHPGVAIAPLYRFGDVHCVVTDGANDGTVQTTWAFVDDGELAVTGDKNPYFGTAFKRDPVKEAEFEQRLVDMERDGWKHSTVEAYAARAKELAIETPELPRTVDGTWQPKNTANVGLWMGIAGLLNGIGAEADNEVLRTNAIAGREVRSAEALLDALDTRPGDTSDADRAALRATLDEAWRHLLLGQVSDSTGWNPFVGERNYAITHAVAARSAVQAILAHPTLVSRIVYVGATTQTRDDPPPVQPTVKNRGAELGWKKRVADGPEVWELSLRIAEAGETRDVEVNFPRSHDRVVTTMALEDDTVVDFPLSEVGSDPLVLPAAMGLVGLADDLFLVKRLASMHLAVHLPQGERVVRFFDATGPSEPFTWDLLLVRGTAAQALAVAHAENLAPLYELDAGAGCGCGGATADVAWIVPLALAMVRRRRLGTRPLVG